ncbi:MAG: molybdate ABC transporter substrate-binding protein [Deltaproteobacteria bacterium]|nr:molybdate ABC transporter substrate-binding protein [Deltaproteobacteria bacterium]
MRIEREATSDHPPFEGPAPDRQRFRLRPHECSTWRVLGVGLFGACVGFALGTVGTVGTVATAALKESTDTRVARDSDVERANVMLTVFAASSLAEAFDDLARDFETSNPNVVVRNVFAGSQILRLQIEQGANADVFASAHEEHLERLMRAGALKGARPFAENELVVIVPTARERLGGLGGTGRSGRPAVRSFEELNQVDRIVIGSENVPAGVYARAMLSRAEAYLGPAFVHDVRSHVVSQESNVRLIRAKVELGEADAAFVYRTDALGSSKVEAIEIPPEINVRARYFMGVTARAKSTAAAEAFVAHVLSPEGQGVLARRGFASLDGTAGANRAAGPRPEGTGGIRP